MNIEMNRLYDMWSEKRVGQSRKSGCGIINCRSKLWSGNSVKNEIQQILDQRMGRNREIPENSGGSNECKFSDEI